MLACNAMILVFLTFSTQLKSHLNIKSNSALLLDLCAALLSCSSMHAGYLKKHDPVTATVMCQTLKEGHVNWNAKSKNYLAERHSMEHNQRMVIRLHIIIIVGQFKCIYL